MQASAWSQRYSYDHDVTIRGKTNYPAFVLYINTFTALHFATFHGAVSNEERLEKECLFEQGQNYSLIQIQYDILDNCQAMMKMTQLEGKACLRL